MPVTRGVQNGLSPAAGVPTFREEGVPVAFVALSAVEVFESHFMPCCGESVALVGSAENTSRGFVQVRLGRCPSCERHQWASTQELTIPWECGMQVGMYFQRLRAEVLSQLY
jgi:hypothetical protein